MRPAATPSRIVAVFGTVLMVCFADQAHAEGRFCGDVVESGNAAGSTKEEATAKAEHWWSSRAGSLGRGYEKWENARDRNTICKGGDGDGTFHCKATARPCLPEGTLPENVPKLDM